MKAEENSNKILKVKIKILNPDYPGDTHVCATRTIRKYS
jgi:hypothetical protein